MKSTRRDIYAVKPLGFRVTFPNEILFHCTPLITTLTAVNAANSVNFRQCVDHRGTDQHVFLESGARVH